MEPLSFGIDIKSSLLAHFYAQLCCLCNKTNGARKRILNHFEVSELIVRVNLPLQLRSGRMNVRRSELTIIMRSFGEMAPGSG